MADDDYNFLYSLIDKLWKDVSLIIAQKAQEENEIPFSARCNLGAVFRLFKLAYPRVDPGDTKAQSHIFLDPPVRSERIIFTSTVNDEKVKKSVKSKGFH